MSIVARDLTKVFQLPQRDPGLRGAFRHLVRPRYADKVAVDRVSFSIEDGEAVAYIGPNGAGKSTTIKMLTGILYATSGDMRVQGIDPHRERQRNARNIGVVFGQRTQLWWDIPVVESLRLLKDIYEVPDARYAENLRMFTDVFGLGEFMNRSARKLSLGQRMRADLAAALLHDPAVLYLDEPTIGLDIAVKESMRSFIQYINRERGTTIILTSHDLKDIEDLCQRVIVIDEGRIACDAELSRLTRLYAHERSVCVMLKRPDEAADAHIRGLPGLRVDGGDGFQYTIAFDANAYTAYEVIRLVGEHADIQDVHLIEPDIKGVIAKVYRSELKVAP